MQSCPRAREHHPSTTAVALSALARAVHAGAPVPPVELVTDLLTRLLPAVPSARSARLAVYCSGGRQPDLVAATEETAERPGTVALDTPLPAEEGVGSLTFYADGPFPPGAPEGAADAAAVCSVAVAAVRERLRADNLEKALASSRQIAAAVGIVMAQQRCTYEEAFERIKVASQRGHRKMRDLADEILLTGEVPHRGPAGMDRVGRLPRVQPLGGPARARPEPSPPRRAGRSSTP